MASPSRYLWVLCLLAGVSAEAWAQKPRPGLSLELNRFHDAERPRALVEGAVEIPYPLLEFEREGTGLRARARVEVTIEDATGAPVYRVERDIQPEAASRAIAASDRVSSIETFAVYAPPGRYTTRARVVDLRAHRDYELAIPLVIDDERPLFSDVLLSNRVRKDVRLGETYLPYLIGNTMFSPNPRRMFSRDAPLVYFYYEIQPSEEVEPGDTVRLRMKILDASDRLIKDLGLRTIRVREGRTFDLGSFHIGGIPAGRYRFQVACEGCAAAGRLTSEFDVVERVDALTFLDGFAGTADETGSKHYADLAPAQVDSVIHALDLWFTPGQRRLLSTLDGRGKKRFLDRWWESMDPEPRTEENEAKRIIEARLSYADRHFASAGRLGRDTDRGRIFLMYGPPTESVDRPAGAYMIWVYRDRGQTFAFGDFLHRGDYRLIYSSDPRFSGEPAIQRQVDGAGEKAVPLGDREYERIAEEIRRYRESLRH